MSAMQNPPPEAVMIHSTTTEALEAVVAAGVDAAPGPYRAAKTLLASPLLDTTERRDRALQIAWTGQNLGIWGRYSEAVHHAALELSRMIREGKEAEEHYCERTARECREREQAARSLWPLGVTR